MCSKWSWLKRCIELHHGITHATLSENQSKFREINCENERLLGQTKVK